MSGNVPAATSTPATVQLTVGAKPLSTSSNLTSAQIQGDISATLTVTVGGNTFTIPVSETAVGAFPSWSTSSIALNVIQTSQSFSLLNAASAPTAFTLTSNNSNLTVAPTSGTSSQNSPLAATLTFSLQLSTSGTVTAGIASSAPLCGPMPAPLPVSGSLL
jgi:hypothetical protein